MTRAKKENICVQIFHNFLGSKVMAHWPFLIFILLIPIIQNSFIINGTNFCTHKSSEIAGIAAENCRKNWVLDLFELYLTFFHLSDFLKIFGYVSLFLLKLALISFLVRSFLVRSFFFQNYFSFFRLTLIIRQVQPAFKLRCFDSVEIFHYLPIPNCFELNIRCSSDDQGRSIKVLLVV